MSLFTRPPILISIALLTALCPGLARAEHADREKPVRVEFPTTDLGDR